MNQDSKAGRLESIGYYVFLATVVLAPLAFWPSPYIALDSVKTFIIMLGSVISLVLLGFVAISERKLVLPPKSLIWTSVLLLISLTVSSYLSIQTSLSIFGQGFEIGTVGFLLILMFGALSAYTLVLRKVDRAIAMYAGIAVSFLIVYLFQFLRLVFGPNFMSMSILNSTTSTILGTWYDISYLSLVISIISVLALVILPLSNRMKIGYWVMLVLSVISAFLVNDVRGWLAAAVVFLGITWFLSVKKWRKAGSGYAKLFKNLAWLPLIVLLVSTLLAWNGSNLAGPTVTKLNLGYSQLVLPWQMTVDVASSAIQSYPLFGVGPNHFLQAYLAYKPAAVNTTDAWGAEFMNGFGLIPTYAVTGGIMATLLWALAFIFYALLGSKALNKLPEDPAQKFIIMSSFSASVLIWIISIVSLPSHAIIFLGFVLTAIFLGSSVSLSLTPSVTCAPQVGTRAYKMMPAGMIILILFVAVWGLIYLKKTVAMVYFSSGVKQLTLTQNFESADAYFAKALKLDNSDVFWQGRAEAALGKANAIAATVTANTPASTTQVLLKQIADTLNAGIIDARNGVAANPNNYYNYIFEARVAEAASNYRLANGYENAVQAYGTAIRLNPFNPSLYLNLARLEASQAKYDDAIKTLGAALQVKNNYLDAVFALSQVYAAKGDLNNAEIAASVASQLNPSNPVLFFQLGILQYNNKDYAGAAKSLSQAVTLQPDYANAQYFLGLAQVRLGNIADAVGQFQALAKSNPDNKEVAMILENLQAGKSPFADAKPPVTAPEKRPTLPIKQK